MNSTKNTAAVPSLVNAGVGDPPEIRLLLICQSEGLRNRYSGLAGYEESDDNSGLTALGWEQTNLLASWLKTHERIDVLLSGPQLRSRLTAQRIGQTLGLPVKVRTDLPQYAPDRIKAPGSTGEVPRLLSQLSSHPAPIDPEFQQFAQTVVAVLDLVITEHWGKTIAFVMNGAALATIARQFFGAQQLPVNITHAGITEFIRINHQWRIVCLNRHEHLPQSMLAPAAQLGSASQALPQNYDPEELARVADLYNRLGVRAADDRVNQDKAQRMRDLLKFARLPSDLRILDVGTGVGLLALLLGEEGAREVIGIDISPVMLESAEYLRLTRTTPSAHRVSFRMAPAQALPFSDESFDAVVCRLVLHHTAKPERILHELMRILKIGGILILADTLGLDDPVKRATQNAIEERRNPVHVAVRTAEQYRKLVINCGLSIEGERTAVYDRELDEWLEDMQTEPANRLIVREMVEAGLETDASGLHARRQNNRIHFDQRLLYLRAVKRS